MADRPVLDYELAGVRRGFERAGVRVAPHLPILFDEEAQAYFFPESRERYPKEHFDQDVRAVLSEKLDEYMERARKAHPQFSIEQFEAIAQEWRDRNGAPNDIPLPWKGEPPKVEDPLPEGAQDQPKLEAEPLQTSAKANRKPAPKKERRTRKKV